MLLFTCSNAYCANEYITEELLNTPQENEVTLSGDDDTLIDGVNQDGEILNISDTSSDEDLDDNVEEEFKVFDLMGKDESVSEEHPFSKILKTEISRTDIPSYLLKDYLTFKYKKSPVSETQYYASYQGSISSLFKHHNYSTEYDNLNTDIGVLGKFKNPNYNFKFHLKPVPVKGTSYLDRFFGDIYVVNSQIPNHKIIAGFSRVQTGIEGGVSPYILPFVTRSQIGRNFGNTRSLGLKIVGNYNYADYSVAYGSSGRSLLSGMPGTEFTGWLNLKPFGSKDGKYGKLTIGGGISTGHNRRNYTVGSVYVGYKYKKLWTNFEAAIADGYNGGAGMKSNKATGYAFTAGWKFTPKFQLIGRVDQFDPNRDISHDLKREYTIGLNWFIKGQALKVVLNYVFCHNQNTRNSSKIILATQVML